MATVIFLFFFLVDVGSDPFPAPVEPVALGDTFGFLCLGPETSSRAEDASESLRLAIGEVEELREVMLLSVSISVSRKGMFSVILLAEDDATDALAGDGGRDVGEGWR